MSSYVVQTWVDGATGGTPMSAARLSHMESGIDGAMTKAEAAVSSPTITSIVALTQAQYNALSTTPATTLYVITG